MFVVDAGGGLHLVGEPAVDPDRGGIDRQYDSAGIGGRNGEVPSRRDLLGGEVGNEHLGHTVGVPLVDQPGIRREDSLVRLAVVVGVEDDGVLVQRGIGVVGVGVDGELQRRVRPILGRGHPDGSYVPSAIGRGLLAASRVHSSQGECLDRCWDGWCLLGQFDGVARLVEYGFANHRDTCVGTGYEQVRHVRSLTATGGGDDSFDRMEAELVVLVTGGADLVDAGGQVHLCALARTRADGEGGRTHGDLGRIGVGRGLGGEPVGLGGRGVVGELHRASGGIRILDLDESIAQRGVCDRAEFGGGHVSVSGRGGLHQGHRVDEPRSGEMRVGALDAIMVCSGDDGLTDLLMGPVRMGLDAKGSHPGDMWGGHRRARHGDAIATRSHCRGCDGHAGSAHRWVRSGCSRDGA